MKIINKIVSALLTAIIIVGVASPLHNIEASAEREIIILQQKDPRWESYPYGGSTLGPSACGLFSSLNAVGYLTGHRFTIDEIHTWADYAGTHYYTTGQGSSHSIAKGLAGYYGSRYNYKCTEKYEFDDYIAVSNSYPKTMEGMNTIWNKLIHELKAGRVCITLVQGHFISIVDYDEATDKVLVLDDAPDEIRGTTAYGDWKSKNELYYGSSEGKARLKIRCCYTFLESTKLVKINRKSIDVTENNAKIGIEISNLGSNEISSYGLVIGQLPSNTVTVDIPVNSKESVLNEIIDVSSVYRELSPGTTYYYYAYAVVGDEAYKTDTSSFTTLGKSNCKIEDTCVKNIGYDNAEFSAWCINSSGKKIDKYGIYLGTRMDSMKPYEIDTDNDSTNLHLEASLSDLLGKPLKSNTKYYYQVFVNVDGQTYLSNVYTFNTLDIGEKKYIIIYFENGGMNAPEYQMKDFDKPIRLSNDEPIRKGYTFLGWAKSNDSQEVVYRPGDTYDNNKDLKLYAVWEKNNDIDDTGDEFENVDQFIKLGDINSDGNVTMEDVTLAQKVIAKLIELEDAGKNATKASDLNGDSKLTMEDVVIIQKCIAKLVEIKTIDAI